MDGGVWMKSESEGGVRTKSDRDRKSGTDGGRMIVWWGDMNVMKGVDS